MTDTPFYDAQETRDPAQREAALMAALPGHVARAQQATSAFAESLAGVDAAGITSRAALAKLPVLRKHELLERQKALRAQDPFGGYSAIGCRGGSARSDRTGGGVLSSCQRRRGCRVLRRDFRRRRIQRRYSLLLLLVVRW